MGGASAGQARLSRLSLSLAGLAWSSQAKPWGLVSQSHRLAGGAAEARGRPGRPCLTYIIIYESGVKGRNG